MTEGPLVSVCIPIWNDETYVGEALASVLNQTYKNIEVIFSNNASDDRSVEIINSFNDPRVKVYSNEKNMGGMYNFTKVFTYATGKYMTYLSSDDKVEPDTYEKAVKILEAHPDVVLVNTYIELINAQGKHLMNKKYIFGGGRMRSYWGIRSNFIYGSNIVGEPNGSMWRRENFEKLKEPKFVNGNGWTADLDLKMELMLQGDAWMIPETLGKFRVSANSNSASILKSSQARLFRDYAMVIYRDKRYNLSFFWVIVGTISSFFLEYARKLFYKLFIKKTTDKRQKHVSNDRLFKT
jgi:glycosyltransferase involved in cell wall biosynthesis